MTTRFIETETRIFDFAEASLNLYKIARSLVLFVRKATHDLVAIFAGFLVAFLALGVIPVALLWVVTFIIGLVIGIAFFKYHETKRFAMLDNLERRDVINFHLKIKHTLKRLENLKSSKFLFGLPILGSLMKTYFSHLRELEATLKARAYPNYGKLPDNPIIHIYNPEDPWQNEASDMRRYEESQLH